MSYISTYIKKITTHTKTNNMKNVDLNPNKSKV